MRKVIVAIVIIAVLGLMVTLLSRLPAVRSSAEPRKPQQPISAKLEVSGEQRAGGRVRIALVARSEVEAKDVELRLHLPAGLSVAQGKPTWKGSLERGGEASVEVEVVIPGPARFEVRGEAIARFADATAVAADEALIDAAGAPPQETQQVQRNSRGEPILEFPAETRVYR